MENNLKPLFYLTKEINDAKVKKDFHQSEFENFKSKEKHLKKKRNSVAACKINERLITLMLQKCVLYKIGQKYQDILNQIMTKCQEGCGYQEEDVLDFLTIFHIVKDIEKNLVNLEKNENTITRLLSNFSDFITKGNKQ